MPDKEILFAGLRGEMAYHGHYQKDLANFLGHKSYYVTDRMVGRVKWSEADKEKISQLYNKPVEELFN